jgi:uncharacterized protein (DUF58 family)
MPSATEAPRPFKPASPQPAGAADRVLQRIEWKVLRRLDGMLQGEYQSLFLGQGLDLAGIREYQPGDDVRMMDWNVTARTGQPHIREYHEDREITAWLLLDTSASVDFGTVRARKSDLAVDLAGAISRMLTRRGNRVGAIYFSSAIDRVLPPAAGRRQSLAIVDGLMRVGEPAMRGPTRLAEVLQRSALMVRQRSLIFIVSDFLADPGWEAPLKRLTQRHEVTAVWLRDPREEEIPDIGGVYFEDAETGEQIYVDTGSRRFRSSFEAVARRRREMLESTFARSGVDLLSLSTESDPVDELIHYAARRSHRMRGRPARVSGAQQ